MASLLRRQASAKTQIKTINNNKQNMYKNIRKYLFILAVIFPIGGFFVFFQYFFANRAIKTAQAVNEEIKAVEIAEAKATAPIEVQAMPATNIETVVITPPTKPAGDIKQR